MTRKLDLTKREIARIKKWVDYDCVALPEDDSPDGSSCFDEDVTWAYEQMENGNEWGWCIVKAAASLPHWAIADILNFTTDQVMIALGMPPDSYSLFGEMVGTDYLGACSYWNKGDFMSSGGKFGYWHGMKITAFNDLISQVADVKRKVLSAF